MELIAEALKMRAGLDRRDPVVELVVPIYNEQATLEASIRRVHSFATAELWMPWRITIADNASTDSSPAVVVYMDVDLSTDLTALAPLLAPLLAGHSALAAQLLPLVADDSWFFDTELLVLAERAGLRIYEVPVDWVDDPDSKVHIVDTALADMRGVARNRLSPTSITRAA